MKSLSSSAAIVLFAAVLAVPLAIPATPSLAATAHAAYMADNHVRAGKLIGAPVYNDKGEEIGTIREVLVAPKDPHDLAVLSVGAYLGTGPKLVAVPLSRVHFRDGKVMMPRADKAMLSGMAAFTSFEGGSG